MRNIIINNCLNYLKKYKDYNDVQIKELEYGLVSIYLTISKIIIISIIALIIGVFKEMLIFMILFNILRTTGFGLHATKSYICLISSIIIFICIPFICINIYIDILIKSIICIFGIIFMFKNSPADTYKRPIVNKTRRLIYKYISTIMTIIFSFIAIIIKNNFLSNCLIFSIILENLVISPYVYRLFKLPYNNYITYLEKHPDLIK